MSSTLLWILVLASSSALSAVAASLPTITFAGQACDGQVTPQLYTSPSPGAVADLADCVERCEMSSDCRSVTFYDLSKWCTHFYTPCASLKKGHGAVTVTPVVDPYWTSASIGDGKGCGAEMSSSGKQESLAKCLASCDLVSKCQSVTFYADSKHCSHFSAACAKSSTAKAVSMVKRTQRSKCDEGKGEIFTKESSAWAADLAACKKSCEDDAKCKSITFWLEGNYCSHFSTACINRTPTTNTIAVTLTGAWVQTEPTGCATKCGVTAANAGTGIVACTTSSCNADTEPAPKQCPKTQECGFYRRAEPRGCATKCGVAAGKSGTPGAVTCSTSSCDADAKPAPKQCPKTVDCGKWIQAEPSDCATKCGVAEGKSGTPGAVTCSTSSCDADAKPAPKQCPKTVDCGNWIQAEPTGCATRCGVGAGTGTPGAVTCSTSTCSADAKPQRKTCPKTGDCGKWIQAEPTGCATKCGVAAGKSGTPGFVGCTAAGCNPDIKPTPKLCPKTAVCVCSCPYGSPKTGADCTAGGASMCKSCDRGFTISDDQTKCLAWAAKSGTELKAAMTDCVKLSPTDCFKGARGPIGTWDVSEVTDMTWVFSHRQSFTADLSKWDVSSVTDMNHMFAGAKSFKGDISKWSVSKVRSTSGMFVDATSFNGDLSNWDVSSVTDMKEMFKSARAFNGNIYKWDVSRVTTMAYMFYGTLSFNGDLSKWDVSSVTSMEYMFTSASSFKGGDLSNWDLSSVTDMLAMFQSASSFNGDISKWDVSSVTRMDFMFGYAGSFNGDISKWDVSGVTSMGWMFQGASSFNGDINKWDVSKVNNMLFMFQSASSFRQTLCGAWKTTFANKAAMFVGSPGGMCN